MPSFFVSAWKIEYMSLPCHVYDVLHHQTVCEDLAMETGLMNYYPQFNQYQPLGQFGQTQQQSMSLVKVSGLEGARAYQMPPNSAQALFHEQENLMYVKTTDGAGFPTIRTFRYEEVAEKNPAQPDFVTKEDFRSAINEIKEILNGKQSIQQQQG